MCLLYKLNYQWYNALHTKTIKRIKIITKLITFDLGLVGRYFSRSKIDKFIAFQRKSLKYPKENLSNLKHKSLKCFSSNCNDFDYKIKKKLDPFCSKLPFLYQDVTYPLPMFQSPVPPSPLPPFSPLPPLSLSPASACDPTL